MRTTSQDYFDLSVRQRLVPLFMAAVVIGFSSSAAQAQPVTDRDGPISIPAGVFRGMPLTATDSTVQGLVDRLNFDSYKRLIRGLADFGDRRQGTEGNVRAVAWIEAQLRDWGYETERHHYMYEGPREQVYATKRGSALPGEMYLLGAHMDGLGGGEAVNDNASGTALVMEIARVLSSPDVEVGRSVRFVLWNNEETGLNGSRAYVRDRAPLQGIEDPVGSGNYSEPRWVGMIQHDKVLFDHGNPVQDQQPMNADIDIEFQLNSQRWKESADLGLVLLNANRMHATEYPAVLSNAMSNTDSTPFMNEVAAISVRENRRLYEIGRGSDPHWHRATDLFDNYTDVDFRLGFAAMQTTFAAVARLAGARVIAP